ncbi:hypothetical protein MARPO_0065s0084 [Marchantia polymorpha]|uniref:Uncharacterized protein n=1 Tax=Marchantia polymorpha TaxID=3197 RepID=A0A2R6WQZ2_MARPO|nr:hypothetical protein MARPO_0065s0084 [Marchantia polymorpha]|eukprot:PTQ36288.1 hypothetical protein MARPO_0065s0084 [Marchantia polymorpha]
MMRQSMVGKDDEISGKRRSEFWRYCPWLELGEAALRDLLLLVSALSDAPGGDERKGERRSGSRGERGGEERRGEEEEEEEGGREGGRRGEGGGEGGGVGRQRRGAGFTCPLRFSGRTSCTGADCAGGVGWGTVSSETRRKTRRSAAAAVRGEEDCGGRKAGGNAAEEEEEEEESGRGNVQVTTMEKRDGL